MKLLLFCTLAALTACMSAGKPGPGFAVVELFTSEGCSSCPPADRLIARLAKEYGDEPVYILAYHVDYWDHQGWKDRFSNHAFTERQGRYAEWLRLSTVYTPQVVVNGVAENVGSNEAFLRRVIASGLAQHPEGSLTLHAAAGRSAVAVSFQTTGTFPGASLVLALVQKDAQTDVKAGENAGRNLSHVQIVRALDTADLHKTADTLALPADYTPGGWEVIGFVQRASDGQILCVARCNIDGEK
ncbi:DUF1223 domain-containing protein [Dinghuibacter silviterrae]|uniref:DUF1223 domain-containing protein n=1 Tax=Dinghuibacter silviterrae TaxID=1539049 RepID=A0A4R8DFL3_9BACT|nr:DUF1223 domain-containing protein [Dinghuibacter silviterrae]TDW96389.1 hypothetical protein EDB95_4218 [Dinghuibacter silviterrae]